MNPLLPVAYGLDQLLHLSEVHIKQKKSIVNEYIIQSPDGNVLSTAKEDETTMGVLCGGGKDRKFRIHVCDNESKEIFWIRRPATWGPDKMVVTLANGQVISIVRRKSTNCKIVFHLNDSTNKMVFKIKSLTTLVSQRENTFMIYTPDGHEVGYIKKLWRGYKRELFTHADDFVIKFPDDLDVRYKAAIISTCFLIDFKFYHA